MTHATTIEVKQVAGRTRAQEADRWNEASLRQAVERLQRRLDSQGGSRRRAIVDDIVRLGMQPDILAALRQRRDPAEAVRDLATRYAFQALMGQGRSFGELDGMSQALIQRTLDTIHKRATRLAREIGEDPLEAEPGLLISLCKTASQWVPQRPLRAHITWKLQHYEGAISRAMRQIENLVKNPDVTDAFVVHVLEAEAPDELKGHLLQMARGGGRRGVDCEAVIRFFARPATVRFVKRFAATVQTARTLYAEEEYGDLRWLGKRKLPACRRQGYLDTALAQLQLPEVRALDDLEVENKLPWTWPDMTSLALRGESFESWVSGHALDAQPDNPLWQAAALLYVRRLAVDKILALGLADAKSLADAQERMEALRANPDVWQAWLAATLG